MKKLSILSLVLVTGGLILNAAEVKTGQPVKEVKKQESFISGLYIAPVGIIKYANLTDKAQWGAGVSVGFNLNKHVTLDVELISFKDPNNWEGVSIDETDVTANFALFTSENKQLNLYGVSGVARDWEAQDWGLDIGAGLAYRFTKTSPLSVFGQYVYQVWKEQEQSAKVSFGIQYNF